MFAPHPSKSNLNNNFQLNFSPASPSASSTSFSTPQTGGNYADWLEEKLLFYLAELKLQPTLNLTHSATNKAVEIKVRPQIKASYHLETERYEVIMYLLDNLADIRAKQPASQHYNRVTAERLSQWLSWPISFNSGQWGVVITVWLRGSPEQLGQSQRQQLRQSRGRPEQGQASREDRVTAANARRENAAPASASVSGQASSQSQTQPPAKSLPTNLDFFDYVNVETHLQDNGNGSVIPSLCFGLSSSGPIKHRLTTLKHLAIAGPTGSGKSGVLRSLLAQVLMGELFHTSSSLVALVDLESITFNSALFEGLPQIYHNKVLTEPGEVNRLFEWLTEQKEWRSSYYNLCYAEDLAEYNRLAQTKGLPIFPTIFVMIEEASELAASMRESLTRPLESILNTGRKFGIFVVLAGQRFHDDTIPSGAKNQCASRLALGDCDTQTLRILEFNSRQHHMSQMTEGRGLFRLNGQVTEVQGLNLPKARFIDLVNQLRGKSGLALLPNGERDWLAPSPANFNFNFNALQQNGQGHFQDWGNPPSSATAAVSRDAAASSSTRRGAETFGTIPAHAGAGAISLGGITTPTPPHSQPGSQLAPASRVTSNNATLPPSHVQPGPLPFGMGAAGPITGVGATARAVSPPPFTNSVTLPGVAVPMPPLPPLPQTTQPLGQLQPLPPGLLGQALSTGVDPLSLLNMWAANEQLLLTPPTEFRPTLIQPGQPVVATPTPANVLGAVTPPAQSLHYQTHLTQTQTQTSQVAVADPELIARTWQAQLQMAEHDPQQKPTIRRLAEVLGWTFYRAQKAYADAKAAGLIK